MAEQSAAKSPVGITPHRALSLNAMASAAIEAKKRKLRLVNASHLDRKRSLEAAQKDRFPRLTWHRCG